MRRSSFLHLVSPNVDLTIFLAYGGGFLGTREVVLSLETDGVGGRSLGGEMTYTAFVKAPLRRSTSMSPLRSIGIRLHPPRRRVWDNRTISDLNCNQASFSFTARL